MFGLKKLNNESGIVLFLVLMTAIIIMILSVGILTQSVNEMGYAQQQIDQLTCDQLKSAFFWNAYTNNDIQNPATADVFTKTVDSRTYTISITSPSDGAGGTIPQVSCTYDSFQ